MESTDFVAQYKSWFRDDGKMTQVDVMPTREDEYQEIAWGVPKFGERHVPMYINRPKCGDNHVRMDMKYSGICHSDCTCGYNLLGAQKYPFVSGHEMCGVVTEVGSKVTKAKVGDWVGVGVLQDACMDCKACEKDEENYCKNGAVHAYGDSKDKGWPSHMGGNLDQQTFGGYTGSQCLHERMILKFPEGFPMERAGPVMCAGITMWDPLRHWGATKEGGDKMVIGIAGIGGLGTMGIKMAKALGHRIVAISSSDKKKALAMDKGADNYVNINDEASRNAENGKINLILSTISAHHDMQPYIKLLDVDGTVAMLGLIPEPMSFNQMSILPHRKSISSSMIGGIKSTQECVDFCAKHKIYPDVELIEAKDIDFIWNKLMSVNDTGLRYVIDIEKSKANADFMPKKE